MAVNYAPAVKTARMSAVREFLHGGYLKLYGGETLLASIALPNPFGYVEGATLLCALTEGTFANVKGRATTAHMCDSKGDPVITGLTVGKSGDVKLDSVDLDKNQVITINSIAFTHA